MTMRRPHLSCSPLVLAVALATTWSCGSNDEVAPTVLNFNRPTDIAFACYGGLRLTNGSANTGQPVIISAEPQQACNIYSGSDTADGQTPFPPGQGTYGSGGSAQTVASSAWYSYVLQSVPGTVGLATWDTKPSSAFTGGGDVTVLDADPLLPGKTGITIGEQPIGIVTDSLGCYIVSANALTCDLSSLSVTDSLNYQADQEDYEPAKITSIPVVAQNGMPMRAKPAAIVSSPATGTIGVACSATPEGLIYVAYPECHMVAGIDPSTGTIEASITFDGSGNPTLGSGDVTCPDECGGGGQITDGSRPTSLDLEQYSAPSSNQERTELAIGLANSNVVTIVTLSNIDSTPQSTSTYVLQENRTNDLGVNQVKISPIMGMGGGATLNTDVVEVDDTSSPYQMQFLYAITSDSTIRVANIDTATGLYTGECDTQVDPRYLHTINNVAFLSCMPVAGSNTPPRRAGAIGPGIQIPNRQPATDAADETTNADGTTTALPAEAQRFTVPEGIEIFKIDYQSGAQVAPGTLIGYFGIISASNGQTYILNVNDDAQANYVDATNPLATAIPYDIAHQLRDGLPDRGSADEADNAANTEVITCAAGPDPDTDTGNLAGPRSVDTMVQTLPTSSVELNLNISTNKTIELPSVRQVVCTDYTVSPPTQTPVEELSFAAPTGAVTASGGSDSLGTRDVEYPDIMGMSADETWTFTWEGDISIDSDITDSNGPAVRTSTMSVDSTGMYLTDQTAPYCNAGTQPWDIIQLRGCDPTLGNADCPPNYDCFVHPDSQVAGIGACMLSTEADRLESACREYLISQRRYTIKTATDGTLTLLPRKHVLRTSPITGCTSDTQCQQLATYALQNNSSNNPIDDNTGSDTHSWACMYDPDRAPDLDGSGNLMNRCIETCTTDADCDVTNVCQNGLCYEGIEPPQSCINAPQKYEIRVGEAFAVQGTLTGFEHPIIADANGNCIKDPTASPFQIGRLPLRAPACNPAANAYGILPDGTVDNNPCEMPVDQFEAENTFMGACVVTATNNVHRQAQGIIFRNSAFNLTMIDPTYPGDKNCIGDRGGSLVDVPLMMPLGQLSQRITAGFTPLTLEIQPALPGKVMKGPTNSIWVIDTGDYLSTDVDISSTEGKVYRIESIALDIINVLE